MPAATSATRRNRTSHMHKLASSKLSGPYALPLRPDSEESDDTWSDSQSVSESWQDLDLSQLDEPKDYQFQSGNRVWVRTCEHNWRLGKVVRDQPRKHPLIRNPAQEVDYYQVQFGVKGKMNTRKYFAPLNGEMKPDTPLIREMLQVGGWFDFLAVGELESD